MYLSSSLLSLYQIPSQVWLGIAAQCPRGLSLTLPKFVLAQVWQRMLGDLDTLTLMDAPKDWVAVDNTLPNV
jgi:hypothetical protein